MGIPLDEQVRILQNVTNNMPYAWSDFHLESPDSGAEFYKVYSVPVGWDVTLDLDTCDFVATEPQYYVNPDEVFVDGVVFRVNNIDSGTGEGDFTITKEPTYIIPEPASLAALLGGLTGLAVFFKRRKV